MNLFALICRDTVMRYALSVAFLMSAGMAFANPDVEEAKKPEQVKVTTFVQSQNRVSKRLVFLFDCSTSMGEDSRFQNAIAEVRTVLQQPLDEAMFSMVGFQTSPLNGHKFFVWEGVPEPPKIPKGWAGLPSLDVVKKADKWLTNIDCTDWTDIFPAISKAFDLNKDREKVTIILFSDGNNTYPNWNGEKPGSVVARIKKLQDARVKRGMDKILIFVFGVGINQNVKLLSGIARAGNGSYLTTEKVCQKCATSKEVRADFQQFHEDHVEKEEEAKEAEQAEKEQKLNEEMRRILEDFNKRQFDKFLEELEKSGIK